MKDTEFNLLLEENHFSELSIKDQYNGIVHLVTAANGAEDFYTLENNSARTETPEEARKLDRKGKIAWSGANHFNIIPNRKGKSFNDKIKETLDVISNLIGVTPPSRIREKIGLDNSKRIKRKRKISKEEFNNYYNSIKAPIYSIEKNRYTFCIDNN